MHNYVKVEKFEYLFKLRLVHKRFSRTGMVKSFHNARIVAILNIEKDTQKLFNVMCKTANASYGEILLRGNNTNKFQNVHSVPPEFRYRFSCTLTGGYLS